MALYRNSVSQRLGLDYSDTPQKSKQYHYNFARKPTTYLPLFYFIFHK